MDEVDYLRKLRAEAQALDARRAAIRSTIASICNLLQLRGVNTSEFHAEPTRQPSQNAKVHAPSRAPHQPLCRVYSDGRTTLRVASDVSHVTCKSCLRNLAQDE